MVTGPHIALDAGGNQAAGKGRDPEPGKRGFCHFSAVQNSVQKPPQAALKK
jgi:hypothetical protein